MGMRNYRGGPRPRGGQCSAPRPAITVSAMTLIVANRIARGIRLAGDSKITDRDAILRGELKGALKVIILEPRVCVAFSGGVNRCLDAIRRLHVRQRIARNQRLDTRGVQDLLGAAALHGHSRARTATPAGSPQHQKPATARSEPQSPLTAVPCVSRRRPPSSSGRT